MFNHLRRRNFVRWSLLALPVMVVLSGTPSAAVETPAPTRLPVYGGRSAVTDASGNRVRLPVARGHSAPGAGRRRRHLDHARPLRW